MKNDGITTRSVKCDSNLEMFHTIRRTPEVDSGLLTQYFPCDQFTVILKEDDKQANL